METHFNSEQEFIVHPWVAHRTYKPLNDTPRTVLSNDRDHEFLGLEGEAALSWDLMAEQGVRSPKAVSEKLNIPLEDVTSLFADLVNANLIKPICDSEATNTSTHEQGSLAPAPNSERYYQGQYTEPSPGGSNLDVEFEFQNWALSHGFLWSTLWELTYRCNESCVHCFNPGASHSENQRAHRKTDELSFDEANNLLDQMKSLGVFRLLFTGGEVALRRDFFELLQEAKSRGFSVTVFTNGTLFNDDDLARLAKSYPHRVELSIYSPIPEIHDRVTRLPGSFEKTKSVAIKLREKNITVALKMSVMAETINSVAIFRELCQSLDVESQVDYGMSPGVDGAREPLTKLLPEPLALIRAAMTPGEPLFVGTLSKPNKSEWSIRKTNPVCGAGRTTMSISPEGHIYPCNSLPIHMGSVRSEGLEKVWQSSFLANKTHPPANDALSRWQNVKGENYRVCGSFRRCAWCHKCPGMAFLEGGDELGPSTTNCRNAAARMIAFDLIEEGKTVESISAQDLVALQERYSENTPLWNPLTSIESRVSIEILKKSLRARTKATALERNPDLG